jgi:formylglycine-generating enzyme
MARHRALLTSVSILVVSTGFAALWLRARDGEGDALDRFAMALQIKPESPPRFVWRSVNKKHWQAEALEATGSADSEPPLPDVRGDCPINMVDVAGKMRLDSYRGESSEEVEALQNKTCTNWINRDFPARCAEFSREQWLPVVSSLPTRQTHFCIDQFEYPNVRGQNPIIVVAYTEAASMCSASGKRLCTESEWTFACEGEEATPYPTGYVRDPDACVLDRNWRPFTEGALSPRDGDNARVELDRLWQAEPSGSRPKCKSVFGVYDMTGNVDEWTRTVRREGYASILKGGYWGPVRARCRASTRAHDEGFVAYQQGFRCCADPPKKTDVDAGTDAEPSATVAAPVPESTATSPASTVTSPAAEPTAITPDPTSAPPAPVPAPTSIMETAERLVLDGLDAGALVPETHADEIETLSRKRAKLRCAYTPGTAQGPSAWLFGLIALVAARTRRRKRA